MWILLAMIVVMPFEKNPYLHLDHSFLGVLPDLTAIKLLGVIGLVWAVMQTLGGRVRLGLVDAPQARAFFLFLLLAAIAAVHTSWPLSVVTRLLAVACLFPLVAAVVQRERHFWLVLKTLTLVMILVFPYAVRQMLRFEGRLGVGLNEPNYTALALLIPIPLAVALAQREHLLSRRLLWLTGVGILTLQLVLTGSRGGFVGLIVVLFLIAFRLAQRRLLAVSSVTLLLALPFALSTTLSDRIVASISDAEIRDYGIEVSNGRRLSTATAGLNMILAHPITGVGLGNFKFSSTRYGASEGQLAHMTYLEVAAELGLPALAAFLAVFWTTLRSLNRSRQMATRLGRPDLESVALAMHIGLVGWLVSAIFLSAQYEKLLWFTVALSICLERLTTAAWRTARNPQRPDRAPSEAPNQTRSQAPSPKCTPRPVAVTR
jgi:O-antigen ligase